MPTGPASPGVESGSFSEIRPPVIIGQRGRLKEALALMDTIPEPEGTDAVWEAVERGIREAREFTGWGS